MELRRPNQADKETILDMMNEFEKAQSPHDGGFWDRDTFVYEDWLENNLQAEMGINLPDGWVPSIQLVAFEEELAVGFLNLRLRLNDYLLHQGGHIGYSVRPTERRKGYATQMLKEALLIAHTKNIGKLLITCNETNVASRSVILANGGRLEDNYEGTERYWIEGDSNQ